MNSVYDENVFKDIYTYSVTQSVNQMVGKAADMIWLDDYVTSEAMFTLKQRALDELFGEL